MRVTAILKGPADSNGQKQIHIRINDGRKRSFKATGIRVLPNQFKGRVVNHPDAKAYNDVIMGIIVRVQSEIIHGTYNRHKANPNLYEYIQECMRQWDKTKASETLRQHLSETNKLKGFAPSVKLGEITSSWLYKYQAHCFEIGNTENTVWKSFKFLRLIIKKAHREKLIADDPFQIFKMPRYRDPKRIYLSKEQVTAIDEVCQDARDEIMFIGTWFVVGCFTGMRFGDMAAFRKKDNIKNGRLVLYTQKTREVISLPLDLELKRLFERVNYKPITVTNTHANRVLKIVAELAGIKEHVSFHISRHTFGTLAMDSDIRIEVVGKMLGHTNLKTTAIYAKLTNKVIDAEIKKMR